MGAPLITVEGFERGEEIRHIDPLPYIDPLERVFEVFGFCLHDAAKINEGMSEGVRGVRHYGGSLMRA